EDRPLVRPLRRYVAAVRLGRPGQPLVGGEPAVVGVAAPGDRRPAAVAAARVELALRGHDRIFEADLLAGVEHGRPPQAEQDERRGPGAGLRTAVAGAVALVVVVRQHPGRPGAAPVDRLSGPVDLAAPAAGAPRRV